MGCNWHTTIRSHSSRKVQSMNISTLAKLVIRAISLGGLALVILAITAKGSFAQIPYTTTLPTLAPPSGGFVVPEPAVAPVPDAMTVSIANGLFPFSPGTGLSITMFDLGVTGGQIPSDLILFDNSGPGGTAMITFLSDDEQGNLFPGRPEISYTPLEPVLEPKPAVVTIPIADLIGGGVFTLTATMFSDSDGEGIPNILVSDFMTLSVPEPSTVCLSGIGLAALAGMAYRRRRTRTTA
jgi:hypothetical protein